MDVDEFVSLARRWPTLDALREGPLDRRDLQDQVGVSRPTIHRQIRALDTAGLLTKRAGAFELTPAGELVASEFARAFKRIDTASALSRVMAYLPPEALAFDVGRLRDAEITLPHPTDPFAPTRRFLQHVHAADHIRMLTYTFLPEANPATRQCFLDDDQEFEGVFDPGLVDALLADSASAVHFEELLARGMRLAVAAEPVPLVLTIADGTVLIGAVDDGGSPQGVIISDDADVRAWAEETVDSYLEHADPVSRATVETRALAADGGT